MREQPENADDEKLLKLLALKKYELPPPSFFEELHSEIMRKVARARSEPEDLEDLRWVRWLMELVELRPILVGLAGAVVCLLCILAVLYSERMRVTPGISPVFLSSPESVSPVASAGLVHLEATNQGVATGVTNPVPAGGFSPVWLEIQPVNWSTQGK